MYEEISGRNLAGNIFGGSI